MNSVSALFAAVLSLPKDRRPVPVRVGSLHTRFSQKFVIKTISTLEGSNLGYLMIKIE